MTFFVFSFCSKWKEETEENMSHRNVFIHRRPLRVFNTREDRFMTGRKHFVSFIFVKSSFWALIYARMRIKNHIEIDSKLMNGQITGVLFEWITSGYFAHESTLTFIRPKKKRCMSSSWYSINDRSVETLMGARVTLLPSKCTSVSIKSIASNLLEI